MSKTFTVLNRSKTVKTETDDGSVSQTVTPAWYIEYRNSEWKDASLKCVLVTYIEHRDKFIELLEEAGYKQEKDNA